MQFKQVLIIIIVSILLISVGVIAIIDPVYRPMLLDIAKDVLKLILELVIS